MRSTTPRWSWGEARFSGSEVWTASRHRYARHGSSTCLTSSPTAGYFCYQFPPLMATAEGLFCFWSIVLSELLFERHSLIKMTKRDFNKNIFSSRHLNASQSMESNNRVHFWSGSQSTNSLPKFLFQISRTSFVFFKQSITSSIGLSPLVTSQTLLQNDKFTFIQHKMLYTFSALSQYSTSFFLLTFSSRCKKRKKWPFFRYMEISLPSLTEIKAVSGKLHQAALRWN